MIKEFQRAILARVNGDTDLMRILRSAQDRQHPAEDGGDSSLFPYLTVKLFASPFDTDTTDGHEVVVRFSVWSRSGSNGETMEVQSELYRLFHRAEDKAMPLTGSRLVLMEHQSSDVNDDPDGITIHGVSEYRALIDGPDT